MAQILLKRVSDPAGAGKQMICLVDIKSFSDFPGLSASVQMSLLVLLVMKLVEAGAKFYGCTKTF